MITNSLRYKAMFDRYKLYHDNYKDLAVARMLEIYSKANELKLTNQIDLTNNVFKSVIEQISQVYSYGFKRSLENETILDLYKQMNFDSFMIETDKKLNAFNDIVIQVAFDYKRNIPQLIFRYPHRTKVRTDDFLNPIEVEYFVEQVENEERWAYWSETEHYYKIYDKQNKYKIVAVTDNDEMINPYEKLPFIFLSNGFRDIDFYDINTGSDLVSITLDNSIYQTFKKYLIKWQSFKQLVVTGSNVGAISGQMLDPSQALTAEGDNVDIKLLDLQANLEQLDNSLKSDINQVLVNYNISPSTFNMTSQLTSGFALQMENLQLDKRTLLRQNDFVWYEKDIYETIIMVANANGLNIAMEEFTISFNAPTYPMNEDEKATLFAKQIDIGLISPVEMLVKEYEITEEEAKVKLANNIKERNELYNKVQANINMTATAEALLGAN